MLSLLFGPFYFQLKTLEAHVDLIKETLERPGALGPDFPKKSLQPILVGLKKSCADFHLPESEKHIDRVLKQLKIQIDYEYLRVQFQDIRDGIFDEACDHSILSIPPERSKLLYEKPNQWDQVVKKFPSTEDNVASAICCYMYDENTASVFHCMRILEVGLNLFAESLNVAFGTEVWHVVLDQIEAEIRELERNWPKGKMKAEFLQFYSTAAKEFRYFKDGWRNYVSHNLIKYDAPQALSTLTHVRDFMIQLSSRLSETYP